MNGIKPPHALEAEREVLSAVFIDPAAMDLLSESLAADDFYFERHQLLFAVLIDLHARGSAIDIVTVQQQLKDRQQYEKIGGARALGELLDRAGLVTHLEHYVAIVRDKAMRRRMVEAGRAIESEGLQDGSTTDEYLDEAERRVFAVLEERATSNVRPIVDILDVALAQIQAAYATDGITGIASRFAEWDRLTHGLQSGDLVIIAARPAMGKTAFAMNVAVNACRGGKSVAVFSLEMPSEQLAQRMLASEARIDLSSLRGGQLAEDEWPRLVQASDELARMRIYIDDTSSMSPNQIRAKCRRIRRRHGLDLVVVDYLQLMQVGGKKMGSREQEISHISRALKGLAKDLGCPVIALSQLNRGLESRTDKRPMLSDLRESGSIEQDADMVCFIYRDEVYNKECPPEQLGIAELIIAKHRNGPGGMVRLKFWQAHTRFETLRGGFLPVPS